MKNIGTYFEIPVADLTRAVDFYSKIFDCNFVLDSIHGNEMAFFPFDEKASGITGALCKGEIYKPSLSGSLIYLAVESIDLTTQKIIKYGGEILFEKAEVSGYGFVAEFKDSEGNRVALFERSKI